MAEQEDEPLSSIFPRTKIRKIIKLDEEIQKINAEAVSLVSCAVELFLQFLADKSLEIATEKKRKTVKLDDLCIAVKRHRPTGDFLLDSFPLLNRKLDPKKPPATNQPLPAPEAPAPPGSRRIDDFFTKSVAENPSGGNGSSLSDHVAI